MAQQSAIFLGLMLRTANIIIDAQEAEIWVMHSAVTFQENTLPLRSVELSRVRSVPGVAWAMPLFKAAALTRSHQGGFVAAMVVGVDDATLIGAPRKVVLGSIAALAEPDAVALDRAGFQALFPGEAPVLGKELAINDRRGVVTAITEAAAPFDKQAVIYTRYSRAVEFAAQGRNDLSFILVRLAPGVDMTDAIGRIEAMTGLRAMSSAGFLASTISYYMNNTGIPINFGLVIGLGAIVGIAIVGLTFSIFISNNIRHYAVLKAIGLSDTMLVKMVAVQVAICAFTGFGLGLGAVALFFEAMTAHVIDFRGLYLPIWICAAVAAAILVISTVSVMFSLRRVLTLDPAMAFRQ